MSTEVKDGVFVHNTYWLEGATTVDQTLHDEVTITVRNQHGDKASAEFNYTDRLALARFLLKDVAWGPKQTLQSFVDGTSGGNSRADRQAYLESFGENWEATRASKDLLTWILHGDSSRVDGEWDERIKAFYKARGY